MRFGMILLGLAVGWYGYDHYVRKPAETKAKAQEEARALAQLPPAPAAPDAPPPAVFDENELAKVRSAVDDSDPKVRWQSVKFLLNARDPQAEGMIIKMIQLDDDAGNRKDALLTLADRQDKRFTPTIVAALKDIDTDVRLTALSALSRVGDYSAAPAIGDALRDSEERVRLAAIQTLNDLQNRHNEEVRRIEEQRKKYEEQLAEHRRRMEKAGQRN